MALLILIPLLIAGGLFAQQMSLSSLRCVRILERLPLTPVQAAIPGPIRTKGTAREIHRPGRPGTIEALWAESNIDVALKKRFDLLPQLESITRGYVTHESEAQEIVTELRRGFENEAHAISKIAGSKSSDAISKLLAVREEYPNLRADSVFQKLKFGIVSLENEISARRRGYNAAAERYMTRLNSIPEIILARLFRFRDVQLLEWRPQMVNLAKLDLAPLSEDESGMI